MDLGVSTETTKTVSKYKNDANVIIGHFGLGFYSAFMVAKSVDIVTRSYREEALEASHKGMKDEEIPSAEKDELSDLHTKIHEQSHKREAVFADFAKDNNVLHQLIDLALLQNGMLKGEALSRFIKRSVEMIN